MKPIAWGCLSLEQLPVLETPLVYLIAGEESGDVLGGALMEALRSLTAGNIRFSGVGGLRMQSQGLASLFPMTDLSVMGISEVLGRLPMLMQRIRQTQRDILGRKPAVVVTIDAPDFNFRVARQVRNMAPGIKLVHYIAPSVWAWRPGRAGKIARFLDHLLVILPFEPPFFSRVGLPCTFVGHPALEADHKSSAKLQGLDGSETVMLLLPGSRQGEIARMLPLMIECAQELARLRPDLVFVIPTLADLANGITSLMEISGLRYLIVGQDEKADAFAAAHVALATSGTVALELGIADIPSVICYRATRLTAFIARRLVRLQHVSLINLIMGREVMPEFIQEDAIAEKIIPAIKHLLDSESARNDQKAAFQQARSNLRPMADKPDLLAARVVLQVAALLPVSLNDDSAQVPSVVAVPALPGHRD